MASAHHAFSGELSMRDERRPGLDGPGRMVKSREFGPQNFRIIGFSKGEKDPKISLWISTEIFRKYEKLGFFDFFRF